MMEKSNHQCKVIAIGKCFVPLSVLIEVTTIILSVPFIACMEAKKRKRKKFFSI